MLSSIRSVFVFLLAGGVTWSCSGERVTTSRVTEADLPARGPLSKPAVRRDVTQAVVVARVQQDGAPVSGATVEFSRSVSGRAADYAWSATTDEKGEARVEIGGDDVSGYYQARAWQGGSVLGVWSSIPINGGYALRVDLPVGGKARVTGSSILIPIGLVLPLAEQQRQYSLPIKNGFELALEEVNSSSQPDGASLKFIVENSQGTAEGAAENFNKLIHQDGVPVILGPAISTAAVGAFPIAQQNQVVAFSSTSIAPGLGAIGDFIFRVGLTIDVIVPGSVKATREKLGYQRVVTMVDTIDVFSRSSDEVLRRALTENGVEILARETFETSFETSDTTFAEQLNRIKALNPEAVFVSALSPRDRLEIMVQGRRLGIPSDVPFIFSELTTEEVQAAGDAAEGTITFTTWISTASTPGNQAFVEHYRAKYGTEPNHWAAQSYAALHILAEAIANARSTDASAIRDAMAGIRDLDTILGRFSFDADGEAVYDPIVLVVRGGKFEVFE